MSKSGKGAIRRARERLTNWSARGHNCPVCHNEFRHGCNHSVVQARARLEQNLINAQVDYRLKQLNKLV